MIAVDSAIRRSVRSLGDCCTVQNGYPFKSEFYNERTGLPLIRVRSLKTQSCDIYYNGPFDQSYLVDNGDILIGMDGDFQPCYWQGGKALLNQRVCRLINFIDTADPYYIYQVLKKPLKDIENATYFTTVKHISSFTIQDLQIALPPLLEQRAIAHIIQSTQNVIQACCKELELEYERKVALMQHLFTHGTRGEMTKQTNIGEMPESWGIKPLEKLATIERGRFSHRPRNDPAFYSGSIPFIQTGDVTSCNGYIQNYSQTLNEQGLAVSKIFSKGTIVITIAANIGYTGILNFDSAFPDSLIGISAIDPKIINNIYLNYYLMTQQSSMDKKAPQGTQKNINIEFLNPWSVPVPCLREQEEITAILDAITSKIAALKKEIALLEELFRALLDELMTGRLSTLPLVEQLERGIIREQ